MATTHLSLSAPTQNLYRLITIRGLMIALLCAAFIFAHFALDLPLPYTTLVLILLAMACINIATWLRLNRRWPVTEGEFFSNLLLDIVNITLLLFFCGGASNPFVSYYLVPLCISAATLAWRYTWAIAALSLTMYTFLFFFHIPIPDIAPPEDSLSHGRHNVSYTNVIFARYASNLHTFNLHMVGMWFNFLVSAGLITYFVVKMATALRRHEEQLSLHREEILRNEQVMAVATLAAGTAHELSTPLSTMKVLVTELQDDYKKHLANSKKSHAMIGAKGAVASAEHSGAAAGDSFTEVGSSINPPLGDDLQLLQSQIDQCTNTLRNLVRQAYQTKDCAGEPEPAGDYCRRLMDKWLLMRPEVSAQIHIERDQPEVAVSFPPTIAQSIINLLNNAADANPVGIEVEINWTPQLLTLKIADRGPGVPVELTGSLGKPFITTKGKRGLGLGLFLSHATLSHHRGTVELYNRETGGTLTSVCLPLTQRPSQHGATH